jgi:acyl carrier protein
MCDYNQQVLDFASQRTGMQHQIDDEIIFSGLDSLQLIEMAADLEQRFSVRIESELADIVTFRDLANVIQAHTNQASE